MSEEIKVILEEIRFKAGIYRDHERRGLSFNDEEKNCALLLDYIQQKENQIKEIERLNNIIEDFEIELQREINVREEDTSLEHNTFIIIQNTLKTALKRFRELKGSDKE